MGKSFFFKLTLCLGLIVFSVLVYHSIQLTAMEPITAKEANSPVKLDKSNQDILGQLDGETVEVVGKLVWGGDMGMFDVDGLKMRLFLYNWGNVWDGMRVRIIAKLHQVPYVQHMRNIHPDGIYPMVSGVSHYYYLTIRQVELLEPAPK